MVKVHTLIPSLPALSHFVPVMILIQEFLLAMELPSVERDFAADTCPVAGAGHFLLWYVHKKLRVQ